MPGYILLRFRRDRSIDHSNDPVKSPGVTWRDLVSLRESQRRRSFFPVFLDVNRDRCRRLLVDLYRSINEQMEDQRNRKWPA